MGHHRWDIPPEPAVPRGSMPSLPLNLRRGKAGEECSVICDVNRNNSEHDEHATALPNARRHDEPDCSEQNRCQPPVPDQELAQLEDFADPVFTRAPAEVLYTRFSAVRRPQLMASRSRGTVTDARADTSPGTTKNHWTKEKV